ncbi:MAG: hypothetical protein RLZZ70_205 [Candidatus Parcubacteria bacterium]|jgi:hypothetical protein
MSDLCCSVPIQYVTHVDPEGGSDVVSIWFWKKSTHRFVMVLSKEVIGDDLRWCTKGFLASLPRSICEVKNCHYRLRHSEHHPHLYVELVCVMPQAFTSAMVDSWRQELVAQFRQVVSRPQHPRY